MLSIYFRQYRVFWCLLAEQREGVGVVSLRQVSIKDSPGIFEGLRHGDLVAAVPGSEHVKSLGDTEEMVRGLLDRAITGSELHFSICLGDGRVIGMCAISDFRDDKSARIGYWLNRDYRGQGYGREAVRLLSKLAFDELRLKRIVAVSKSSNDASLKLLLSLGFKQDSESGGEKALSLERQGT